MVGDLLQSHTLVVCGNKRDHELLPAISNFLRELRQF